MSTTEDRLIAALAARADQVHPEDLRAPEVPEVASTVTFLRRPAAYAVGIAAAAAAIAAPLLITGVIGGLGSDDAPTPPATNSPSPTLEPQPDIGGDWPVTQRSKLDLDGDGTPEQVRVRVDGDEYTAERLRLEAELSSTGDLAFGIVEGGESGYHLTGAIDVDGDGDLEPVVYLGNSDERAEVDLRVLDLVDGQLVELEQRGEPPIQNGPVLDRQVDDRVSMMFQTAWWIADDTLYSSRSTQSYAFRGMSQSVPDPYLADVWAWQRDGDDLVPVVQDQACIGNGALGPEPVACPAGGGDVPDVFPAATETIGVGESFEVDLDGGGLDTIALESRASADAADLVITTTYGGEQRLSLPWPAAYNPEVYTTPINVGSWESFALLVADEGGNSSSMTLVTVSEGELVEVEEQGDVPFRSQPLADVSQETWIGPGQILYTRVGPETGAAEPVADLYTWDLTLGAGDRPVLTPTPLGAFCFLFGEGPYEVTRCDG
jgi:hypothetical protein